MSLLLRSSHFIKTFSLVSRRINLNSKITPTLAPICYNKLNLLNKNYSTNPSPIVDLTIKKLDNDARRSGKVSSDEIKSLLSELKSSKSATSTQALMIIRCCGNLMTEESPEVRTQLVQTLWDKLEKLGIPLDISHYNSLLRVYLENEHKFIPTDFLSLLELKGIVPNRVTYQRLISRYCQDGDLEGATKVLEFMKEKNFPISEGVFNALIYGHSQANDMESAEGILSMMRQATLEPTAETYTTLLSGYAKHGDMESIKRILSDCEASLVNSDYLEIIYSLAANGHHQHVDELISKIRPGVGYSADAANFVYRLVSKDQIDTAFKIVTTLSRPNNINGEQLPSGGFLVRHMVRTKQPVEKVLEVCHRLIEQNLHPHAINLATQNALEIFDLDQLVPMLKEFQSQGNVVRIHYFWPLLLKLARDGNTKEVLRVLKTVDTEFGLTVTSETIRDYVLPWLEKPGQVSDLFSQLRSVGVSLGTVTSAYVIHLLSQNHIKEAATVAKSFRARYHKYLLRRFLVSSYLKTNDLQSLVTIAQAVSLPAEVEHSERVDEEIAEEDQPLEEPTQQNKPDNLFNGSILMDIFSATKRSTGFVEHLERVLNAFVENSLPISTFSSDYIQNNLQSNLTENISVALSKLTSEDLVLQPLVYTPGVLARTQPQNPEILLNTIKRIESQGENASGLKRGLLTTYIRNKEVEKAIKLLDELDSDPNFENHPGMYALVLSLCAEKELLEESLKYWTFLNEKYPNVKLDNGKTLKFAYLLLQNDKEQEMIDLLKQSAKTTEELHEEKANLNNVAWRILNLSAEKTNPVKTKQLFELLRSSSYITPNNIILGPLIKAHVLKEDFIGAVEQFEECVKLYRATPWKNELMRHFIDKEDTTSLQRITDLSTSVHGEVNSLYDLMFCFLECGRLRQARKILETPGMRMRPDRLTQILDHYSSQGSVDKIENLLKVTQDIGSIDRNFIYLQLLDLYSESNEVDKALGLWTQIQEENETPSDAFLIKLAKLLKKNNNDVPFSVPVSKESSVQQKNSSVQQKKRNVPKSRKESSVDVQMKNIVSANNVNEAYELYETAKTELGVNSKLNLITLLIANKKHDEIEQVLNEITAEELEPLKSNRLLKSVISNLSADHLHLLEPKLSEFLKMKFALYSSLMKAYVTEGKIKDHLHSLKADLEKASSHEEKSALVRRFPTGGILAVLQSKPELLPEISEVAQKFYENGFHLPMSGLFNYYYLNGLPDEAEKLFEKYVKAAGDGKNFRYSYILRACEDQKDPSFAEPLITLVKQLNNSKQLSNIYGNLIDISVTHKLTDYGIQLLENAVKDNATELLHKKTVDDLQALALTQGKTIPLTLINKISFTEDKKDVSSSSSDSSSDDESVAHQNKK